MVTLNEIFLAITVAHLFLFSGYVNDETTKYYLSYSAVVTVTLFIVFNLGINLYNCAWLLYFYARRQIHKLKGLQTGEKKKVAIAPVNMETERKLFQTEQDNEEAEAEARNLDDMDDDPRNRRSLKFAASLSEVQENNEEESSPRLIGAESFKNKSNTSSNNRSMTSQRHREIINELKNMEMSSSVPEIKEESSVEEEGPAEIEVAEVDEVMVAMRDDSYESDIEVVDTERACLEKPNEEVIVISDTRLDQLDSSSGSEL